MTRRIFTHELEYGPSPTEVSADRAPCYPRVLDEPLPAVCHVMDQTSSGEPTHGDDVAAVLCSPDRRALFSDAISVDASGHLE